MAQIIALFLAIFKAVPILETWWVRIEDARRAAAEKRNADAVEESSHSGDQRPIEDAMGSTKTGKPSGIPGTEVRKNLPGV